MPNITTYSKFTKKWFSSYIEHSSKLIYTEADANLFPYTVNLLYLVVGSYCTFYVIKNGYTVAILIYLHNDKTPSVCIDDQLSATYQQWQESA